MREEFENVPLDKKTTEQILNDEKPEVDSIEIRGYQTTGKPNTKEVLINQSNQSKGITNESLQLRDIKDIQMSAYASEYTITSDQISVGATIVSVIATILITMVLAIGVIAGIILGMNIKVDICNTEALEPHVSVNSLILMEDVESINDIVERDIIQYKTNEEEYELGMVFWYLDPTEQYVSGVVYVIGNMEAYNKDVEENSKLDPTKPAELTEAVTKYGLILVEVGNIDCELMFSIKNMGSFMYFIYDNWLFVIAGLLIIIIILFVIRFIISKSFEAKLFRKIEEERKVREQCQEMLRSDLAKVQNKFADYVGNDDLMEVLSKSDQVVANPKIDAKRKKIEKELEKRRRAQIEELSKLAEKQKLLDAKKAEQAQEYEKQKENKPAEDVTKTEKVTEGNTDNNKN